MKKIQSKILILLFLGLILIGLSFLVQKNKTPVPAANQTANWKTFTSKTEGFTLKYPQEWKIKDLSSGNCGSISGTPFTGSCRDFFDFISPDGVIVRYINHNDKNDDKISCENSSICSLYNIDIINSQRIEIPKLGQVYLVKTGKPKYGIPGVYLHKPLSSETTPKVGFKEYSSYFIDFSLPSKIGGRYTLWVTVDRIEGHFVGTTKFDSLTAEQFYELSSVKTAEFILKSLSYN